MHISQPFRRHLLGHYRALEWSEKEQAYKVNEELGILVQVTVSKVTHVLD